MTAIKRKFEARPQFRNSAQYWEDRYALGGNSGAGSYNRLAGFKAEIINEFVRRNQVDSVIEFGVGDGAQLALAEYPSFVGIDVSPTVIERLRSRHSGDSTKRFLLAGEHCQPRAELSLSLDVIYHLVEDAVFDQYMTDLFRAATRYAIVYASNKDETWPDSHVRHRQFSTWVNSNLPHWQLIQVIPNRYPYDPLDPNNTSFADFYIYERTAPEPTQAHGS